MSIFDRTEAVHSFGDKSRLKKLGGLAAALIVSLCAVTHASAETRSLKLYFIHTKERAEITFKRNGRYDQNGLKKINQFLRDWRRNEPANMDPKVLDLLWEVYRSVGARDHIHIVSAYRSPKTNASLRSRSSGVAENSQHTRGKAIDFYIPGVPLAKLRAAGFRAEVGGVGYYPKSGSPFIHLDTGNVRSWPRMNRNELMALFPDGRTIHVPADGKPLPGYQQAMAAYKSRQKSGATVQMASADTGSSNASAGSGGGLLSALFGTRGRDDDAPAAAARVTQTPAPRATVAAPVPQPVAEPEQPQTIIAALPTRNAPLPAMAPRPIVDVGAPAARPLIAGLPSAPLPAMPVETAPAAEAAVALANVPLPTRRPDYSPAPAVQVASAEPTLPVSAIAAERLPTGGSDAIAEMLAMSAAEARAGVVINNPPVPGLRPRLSAEQVAEARQVAATSTDGNMFALAALPETGAARTQTASIPSAPLPDQRLASLPATPRVAIGRELESGVRTTAKAARPQASAPKSDPKAVVVPVQEELARWTFARNHTVTNAGGSGKNGKAYNVVWTAPETVYTAGFQQKAGDAGVNNFSGKAVTFMPVARFSKSN